MDASGVGVGGAGPRDTTVGVEWGMGDWPVACQACAHPLPSAASPSPDVTAS